MLSSLDGPTLQPLVTPCTLPFFRLGLKTPGDPAGRSSFHPAGYNSLTSVRKLIARPDSRFHTDSRLRLIENIAGRPES